MEPGTREIPLTQGQWVLVSSQDWEELSQVRWCARYVPHTRSYYAARNIRLPNGKWTTEFLHRRILGLARGDKRYGDHIDHDTLNNRRENLRVPPNNSASNVNRRKKRTSTNMLKGVTFNRRLQKWVAQITQSGKSFHLGCYTDPIEAFFHYCMAAVFLHGEFAHA
jgi:hypothetical protein